MKKVRHVFVFSIRNAACENCKAHLHMNYASKIPWIVVILKNSVKSIGIPTGPNLFSKKIKD